MSYELFPCKACLAPTVSDPDSYCHDCSTVTLPSGRRTVVTSHGWFGADYLGGYSADDILDAWQACELLFPGTRRPAHLSI